MKIFGMLERTRLRREFSKYVSPAVLSLIERAPKITAPKMEEKHFQFALINVLDDDSDEVPATIGKVVTTIVGQHMPIYSFDSSLITITLGVPYPEDDSVEVRLKLVNALLAENGNLVRIAHGECVGMVGMFGAEGRWTWGSIIPGFSGILKTLLDTQFGAAIEISCPQSAIIAD